MARSLSTHKPLHIRPTANTHTLSRKRSLVRMSFVHVDAVASTYTDQRKGNPPLQPGVLANREESIDQVEKTPTTRWPSRSHEQMSFVRVDTLDVTSTPTSTKASRLANQEFSPTGRRALTRSRKSQRAPTASPEKLALAIAGLVSRTADDAMPTRSTRRTSTTTRSRRASPRARNLDLRCAEGVPDSFEVSSLGISNENDGRRTLDKYEATFTSVISGPAASLEPLQRVIDGLP